MAARSRAAHAGTSPRRRTGSPRAASPPRPCRRAGRDAPASRSSSPARAPTGSAAATRGAPRAAPPRRPSPARPARRRWSRPSARPRRSGTPRTPGGAPTRAPARHLAPRRSRAAPRPSSSVSCAAPRPPAAPAAPATTSGISNAAHGRGCIDAIPNCGNPSVTSSPATNIGRANPSATADPARPAASGRRSNPRACSRPARNARTSTATVSAPTASSSGTGACGAPLPAGDRRLERHADARERVGEPDLQPRPRVVPVADRVREPRDGLRGQRHRHEHEQRAAAEPAEQQRARPGVGGDLLTRKPRAGHAPSRSATIRGDLARRPPDGHADPLERLGLRGRGPLRAGDDRAGVTHPLARRRLEPGDVRHHRLRDVFRDVGRSALLVVAADLPRHDDQIGVADPASNIDRHSMNPTPWTGSPPIPTHVDCPIPCDVSSWTIW